MCFKSSPLPITLVPMGVPRLRRLTIMSCGFLSGVLSRRVGLPRFLVANDSNMYVYMYGPRFFFSLVLPSLACLLQQEFWLVQT